MHSNLIEGSLFIFSKMQVKFPDLVVGEFIISEIFSSTREANLNVIYFYGYVFHLLPYLQIEYVFFTYGLEMF